MQVQTLNREKCSFLISEQSVSWLTCPQKVKGHIAEEPDSHGTVRARTVSPSSGEVGWVLYEVIVR